MIKIIWHKLTTTTSGGAIIIAFFTILSNVLGLVRDRLLAGRFGAGPILDTYYAAFKLPDLIFNTLVLGALASAFIPVFTRTWLNNKAEAKILANSVINYLLLILGGLAIVFFILAKPITKLIVPGFTDLQLLQTIQLTRIMLLSILFFGVSNVLSGILNSAKRFVSFSMAPCFYNFGIITGILFFYNLWGINGLAWGVVLGAFLHMAVQLPEAITSGWHYHFNWQFNQEAKKVFKLIIPRTLGLAASQLNQLIIVMIGSTLIPGSIAIFNLANNLQTFPSSIFGISLAVAVFPIFSQALAEDNQARFVSAFSLNFRRVIFLIVPVSIVILLLRAQIVRVVLGSGNFNWSNTYYTAQALGWFTVSLFAQSLIPMLSRAFYAYEDTRTPVIISITAIVINILGSFYLGSKMGVEGLVLAFSIASIVNMILLMLILRLKVGYLDDRKIIWSTFKITLNSLAMGVIIYYMLRIAANLVNMHTFIGIFLQGLIAGIIGLLFYLLISLITSVEEIEVVKSWLGKYWRPIVQKK